MIAAPLSRMLGSLALAAALAAPAAAQDRLGALPQGRYVCALPGDAAGAAWDEDPKSSFTVTGASGYSAGAGTGTYLLVEKRVEFTRGPFKGRRFLLLSSGLLQELDKSGKLGRMRCHRAG